MQSPSYTSESLQPILDRIHLDSLGSILTYKGMLEVLGFEEIQILDYSEQLSNHYSRVLEEVRANQWSLVRVCSEDYIEKMKSGLEHWINGGIGGHLQWGMLHFRKK